MTALEELLQGDLGLRQFGIEGRIHAAQRLARTSVARYFAPVIGGTAAAILDNSPSATGGLLRSPIPGREHSAVT